MKFKQNKVKRPRLKIYGFIILIFILALISGVILIRKSYSDNLRPVRDNKVPHVVTIVPGSTTATIADTLLTKGVIRSDWAFEWYVRNHQLRDELKAGTYVLYENQSVEEIVKTIVDGKIASDLVTILPGKRLSQIREAMITAGFKDTDIDAALEPTQYNKHPALTDKPANASLEGYLYPESFQKTAETTPKQLVMLSLDEMQRRLTPEIRQAFSKHGITLHQGVTLASIVELEVSNAADRAQAAQVFLKRYKMNMSLGSDPTAFYGAIIAGKEPAIGYDSPYNTRIHPGIPPGPISNTTMSSLTAVAFPAQTDWLYFVAGDDGKTYFSKTNQEHEALTKQHCTKLCN